MQRVVGMVDNMRTQLQQVNDAALCVLTNLSDASANSVKNDVVDFKDKFEEYVIISYFMINWLHYYRYDFCDFVSKITLPVFQ